MRVAVVDVGANTLRLLVAEPHEGYVGRVREERRRTMLGEDVERLGHLTEEKIARSAEAARKEVRRARKLGAGKVEVVVTSPWRSADNGSDLVEAIEHATRLRVWALTADEEAELGYSGAVASAPLAAEPIAVCDVGGGSTQIAVGSKIQAAWLRSVELGSLRLTRRCLTSDPPLGAELDAARAAVAGVLKDLMPPLPAVALATGGTARALRRFGLQRLDGNSLEAAVAELAALPAKARARRAKVDLPRAHTLPAGAIILGGVARLLQSQLVVANGGVREGVCLRLLEAEAATATA